jgi:tetratricopeptide (TPR) repeat protein
LILGKYHMSSIDRTNYGRHVESITNLGATLMAMKREKEAEEHWKKAVYLRPSRFDAVEHLVGFYCQNHRNKEAIGVIDHVESVLRLKTRDIQGTADTMLSPTMGLSPPSETEDKPVFDYESDRDYRQEQRDMPGADQVGFGSSGYAIPAKENNRIHTLVHARGNLLYGAGDIVGAARAFEEAVLITVGRHFNTIDGLVTHILGVLTREVQSPSHINHGASDDPLLVPPSYALETVRLCFPSSNGILPGLESVAVHNHKAATGTTSNSLLSLAKIFQDSMASSNPRPMPFRTNFGVREILALYYLSISLQKSPSTANNVGILLAGLQQTASPKMLAILSQEKLPAIPGVVPGTGISLALAYYNFGLNLDRKHAHLYTNLGSLMKDLGQLTTAIKMYEEAVKCDPKFDIALANLANAVKDQGRISEAIKYYRRAVEASPDFAEAVCGLANALNSVCGWKGRGGIAEDGGARDKWHVDENNMLVDPRQGVKSSGWIKRVVDLVDKQLAGGELWGQGVITPHFVEQVITALSITMPDAKQCSDRSAYLRKELLSWSGQKWEGYKAIRLVERMARRLTWQWYQDRYVKKRSLPQHSYNRPALPPNLPVPSAPTVLPFHTFTSPMSAKQIRQISQRNGLRISTSTLKAPWLPGYVWQPPEPPNPCLKVGYVSSDFNNHPLAHLMQSVFGMHDRTKIKAYCYATTGSDNSIHRQQIEREAPEFVDASNWSAEKLVKKISDDGIHVLVNLNGYTRGARNEVFAARAAPIQMSFMGFAGTLGSEWCDYLLADETAVPTTTLRPWRRNVEIEDLLKDETVKDGFEGGNNDWIYGENLIYCRDTFFCCDHKQSAPDAKERRLDWDEEIKTRWQMRKEIFPDLPDDAIIIGNFNQLYKVCLII